MVKLLAAPNVEFAALVGFLMIFGLMGVLGACSEPVVHMEGPALRMSREVLPKAGNLQTEVCRVPGHVWRLD